MIQVLTHSRYREIRKINYIKRIAFINVFIGMIHSKQVNFLSFLIVKIHATILIYSFLDYLCNRQTIYIYIHIYNIYIYII